MKKIFAYMLSALVLVFLSVSAFAVAGPDETSSIAPDSVAIMVNPVGDVVPAGTASDVVLVTESSVSDDAVSEEADAVSFNFNPNGFVEQLPKMGIGMAAIFVVIGAIAIVTMALNKVFAPKK